MSPSSTSPSSLNSHELDYHEALYGLVLECLEDAAKKPDISDAEKAQLEEQCAQTRARIATLNRLCLAAMKEEQHKRQRTKYPLMPQWKDKNA
ncbi:hypothetical protein HMN09_01280100 [Mycena chlorophos]|uniref:Uncharacterized protein n=1 Tax=Mycena chlorophos TaxID=658473 RepID=A0A8H6S473_MYCCL|nr:hypothetical protein HMN09_01280100 [Mycena chlorophos]